MWEPRRPILELPEEIREQFLEEAFIFYEELEKNRLRVALIPAPEPQFPKHMIRVAIEENVRWYRELYKNHSPNFERRRSGCSLERILRLKDNPFGVFPFSKYDTIYRRLIFDRLKYGYKTDTYEVLPNELVLSFFEKNEQTI